MRIPVIKHLGRVDYEPIWRNMQSANRSRSVDAPDELWLLEHPPVFTLGLAGKPEHVIAPGDIPVIKIDRGGQVTYHGPGQLVVYLLLDLKRLADEGKCKGVKELVKRIEQSVIDLLAEYGIESYRLAGMPGVYVNSPSPQPLSRQGRGAMFSSLPPRGGGTEGEGEQGKWAGKAKIAAIGLRVANHATYHGLSLNIDMDLEPFSRINPCGYEGLAVTQMRALGVTDTMQQIGERLVAQLSTTLYGKHHG